MDTIFLLAQPTGDANPLMSFLPLLLIIAIFYFLIIRPQKKREEKRKEMIAAVEKGDKIITSGGVHGTVTKVDDNSVLAQVDSNVKLRIDKNSIANVGGEKAED